MARAKWMEVAKMSGKNIPEKVVRCALKAGKEALESGYWTRHLDEIYGPKTKYLKSADAAIDGFVLLAKEVTDKFPTLRCSMDFLSWDSVTADVVCTPWDLSRLEVSVRLAPVVYVYPVENWGDNPAVLEGYRCPYLEHPWPGRSLAVEFVSAGDPACPAGDGSYESGVTVYYTQGLGLRM